MNWKNISKIGLLVITTAYAVYASGELYLCPATNHCDKVNTWVDGETHRITQYNCYISNIGNAPLSDLEIKLSGPQIKEIWEVNSKDQGQTWNLAEWRKHTPLAHGQSHTWGYTVYGDKELDVTVCGGGNNVTPQLKAKKTQIICNLSNNCTVANQWKNGNETNTQYSCSISNNGVNPVSFIDIRINGNIDLYNVWQIVTPNNGLSWDMSRWRIDNPLLPGQSHSWGYIVSSDKPLDVQVCENGQVDVQPVKPALKESNKKVVSDEGKISCFISNNCTLSSEWKNDKTTNKQYSCLITNNGDVPVSFIDVRLNNNTALYNVWELITNNNGLSYDLPKWRIDSPLLPKQSHSWGYIVNDDGKLDIQTCQNGQL